MTKDELYREYVWPTAIQRVKDSPTHLLLLPGIMGSELYDEPGASELWVTLFGYGDHMRGLEFSAVGPTGSTDAPGREVYAPREIVLRPITDPYGKLLNHPGLRPGVYPFDWREDMAFEERRLASFLRELATTVPKVSIVTHSMGGPMLLHLLGQQPSLAANIERIVFCAPPFHGAIKPLSAIETGSDVPTPPWGSYQDGVMRAAASFGGLFQLLVSPRKQWPMKLPDAGEGSVLIDYPIVSDVDLYTTSAWSNPYHGPWREQLLGRAARFRLVRRRQRHSETLGCGIGQVALHPATSQA